MSPLPPSCWRCLSVLIFYGFCVQSAAAGFRLAAIFDRLQEIGASEAEATAATILSGLGFDSEMQVSRSGSRLPQQVTCTLMSSFSVPLQLGAAAELS